jgi:hypothetical protein
MKPILGSIERQMLYRVPMPEDAFYWMQDLSPREYLTCLKDKQMGRYIRKRNFHPNLDNGWKRPRALRSILVTDEEWKMNKTWAQLIEQPSLRDRFAYYKGSVARIVAVLSLLPMTYCLLITTPTVVNLGGNNLQGVLITILSIILGLAIARVPRSLNYDDSEPIWANREMAVIVSFCSVLFSIGLAKSMDLTVESLMEVYQHTIAMGNLGIRPIPDFITVRTLNPFTTLLLVPIFWTMNRVMMNTYSRGVEMKQQFYETIYRPRRGKVDSANARGGEKWPIKIRT